MTLRVTLRTTHTKQGALCFDVRVDRRRIARHVLSVLDNIRTNGVHFGKAGHRRHTLLRGTTTRLTKLPLEVICYNSLTVSRVHTILVAHGTHQRLSVFFVSCLGLVRVPCAQNDHGRAASLTLNSIIQGIGLVTIRLSIPTILLTRVGHSDSQHLTPCLPVLDSLHGSNTVRRITSRIVFICQTRGCNVLCSGSAGRSLQNINCLLITGGHGKTAKQTHFHCGISVAQFLSCRGQLL